METALVDLFSGKLHHKFTGYRLRQLYASRRGGWVGILGLKTCAERSSNILFSCHCVLGGLYFNINANFAMEFVVSKLSYSNNNNNEGGKLIFGNNIIYLANLSLSHSRLFLMCRRGSRWERGERERERERNSSRQREEMMIKYVLCVIKLNFILFTIHIYFLT